MLNRIYDLSQYQLNTLKKQAAVLGNTILGYDKDEDLLSCLDEGNNEEELGLYKCDNCGALIAETEEIGEEGSCKCGKSYLGLED